jgi:DNA-binding transcriptional ArsR family regulator
MKEGPNIIGIAALIGDQARAEVLTSLMSGQALTATELAAAAGVTKQTISSHLAKLVDARLLVVEAQGRHRYFRLADLDVAQLLESLMNVAYRTGATRLRSSPREPAMRKARLCYDHLAGELGVLMYDQLVLAGAFTLGVDGIALSRTGRATMERLDINVDALVSQRRTFCRTCLDWSERRHHLAGSLGSALLNRFMELGWTRRVADTRILTFSERGERALRAWLENSKT